MSGTFSLILSIRGNNDVNLGHEDALSHFGSESFDLSSFGLAIHALKFSAAGWLRGLTLWKHKRDAFDDLAIVSEGSKRPIVQSLQSPRII